MEFRKVLLFIGGFEWEFMRNGEWSGHSFCFHPFEIMSRILKHLSVNFDVTKTIKCQF
jgi:hypothetical protein